MRKYLPFLIALLLVPIYAFSQQGGQSYQDYVRSIESEWDEYSEQKEFEKFQEEQNAAFQAFVLAEEEAYRKYVEDVIKKWNEFIGSSQEEWVDYDENKEVRSIVNFEDAAEKIPEKAPEEKPPQKLPEKPEVKPEIKKEPEKPEEIPSAKPPEKPEVKPSEQPKQKPEEKTEPKQEPRKPEEIPEAKPPERPDIKPLEKPDIKPMEKPKVEAKEKVEIGVLDKPEITPIEKEKPLTKPLYKPGIAQKETPEDRKGRIVIEAVVPANEPGGVDRAKDMIAKQVEKIFSVTDAAKKNVLEGQVKTKKGENVTPQNVKKFVKEEVLPEVKVDPKPVESKDGVERVKVTVEIPMVPEHLKVRAGQYLPSAEKYCDKFEEDLPLIMAVVQTESYFNPLAKSHIPAYGLMQLVPKYGGRDAYKYVYKEDKAPDPKYLYNPDNNLLLGIAYLRLLREKYFYGIDDPEKQEYLMIASYNGGMGRVIKKVLKKYKVQEMSPAEVYEALRKEMPDETKDYLAKVSSRKKNYLAWQ